MKSNIQHIWSVLCSSSTTDKDRNNVTLFNVLEKLTITPQKDEGKEKDLAEGVKSVPLFSELVSLWKRGGIDSQSREIKADVEMEFIDPLGKSLNKHSFPIVFKKEYKRVRSVIKIAGIKITTAGEYNYMIRLKQQGGDKFEEVARIPLEVDIKT